MHKPLAEEAFTFTQHYSWVVWLIHFPKMLVSVTMPSEVPQSAPHIEEERETEEKREKGRCAHIQKSAVYKLNVYVY